MSPRRPRRLTSASSRSICATKGSTGSNKSHRSSTFHNKSRVIRPIPAPISMVRRAPSGHAIRDSSLRKNVAEPMMSALGTGVCSPKPPSTPLTDAGTDSQ
ncbi:hypothetical protein CLUG_00410 [Clavispora lusitaniae ATCC 42720]|uniref:Uncharacterized protein n=1 Tax=Clavispora lusitaniae (strain ATCC 42720) TaxID=306902 RepID=C4XWT7_CLAL4|nr:uncharacterized protein CLUG_00410 [Clavispora lusitaniae ATCC 42720]EEQ36286.1 hypothetical protein CLUG_00410 [Clavispora lusitaniae ATCC 42720]